jgi:hypothetical protein
MSALDHIAKFKPPGPVAAAFLADRRTEVRMIGGPVGGGKTVTTIFDHLYNASQMPTCSDGVMRYRCAIIGNTYGQIERNLYPTWFHWVPKDGGVFAEADWIGGGGRFGKHTIKTNLRRNGANVPLDAEFIFAAIGEQSIEQFMRGFEPTAFGLYEVDQQPEAIIANAVGRLGRYPAQNMFREPTDFRSYVTGDLNMPDIDSWFYRVAEEQRPDGFKLYRQPSGRSSKAENTQNLPKGYYDNLVRLNKHKPHWLRRFVDAEYGPSLDGEPVYPEYSDAIHFAATNLEPVPGVAIGLGLDAGIQRPAAVIGQRLPSGQFRVLAEVVPGRVGPHRFVEAIKLTMAEVAPGFEIEYAYVDPWGFTGGDKQDGTLAWAESVSEGLDIPILPAPSNEISIRLDAVRDELTYMIDANTPALIFSRRCKMLRKGCASHYRYIRIRIGTTEKTADKPEKNEWSDPQDALQYWLLGIKGRYGVIRDPRNGRDPGRIRQATSTTTGNTVLKNATRLF